MAHHNRPGGRALELLLLFLLLLFSAGFLVGSLFLVLAAMSQFGFSGPYSGKLAILAWGALLLALAPIWKAYMRYYKYDPKTLKPLVGKEQENDREGN